MEQFKKGLGLLIVISGMLVAGCATGNEARSSGNSTGSSVKVTNSSLSLADYLRRLTGVVVQGSGDNVRVMVRGASSFQGSNEPLFVVDGRRAGKGYRSVSTIVDVNDIDRIEVLKGSRASSEYGLEGSNGVIVIYTKRE